MVRGSVRRRRETPGGRRAGATRRQKLAWTLLGAALAAVATAGWCCPACGHALAHRGTPASRIDRPLGGQRCRRARDLAGRHARGVRSATLDGMPMLWVRNLASGEARALTGTEDACCPSGRRTHATWDSSPAVLKRVPADGGPVQVVTETTRCRGGAWAPDGTIVFSSGGHRPIPDQRGAGE